MSRFITFLIILAILASGAYGAYWYMNRSSAPQLSFRTAQVTRGELLATIDATGTVEPEEVIDVGAQVAGQILQFGKDADGHTIDYGSRIREGMVLANIDESLYQSDVAQQTAVVAQAEAGVVRAQADLQQMKAKADQATRDWDRAQKLGPSDALSQVSYDTYRANYDSTRAAVAVGDAAIAQAKATLTQGQASLDRVKRNLGYCVIKSPVNGVIIDRRVNIGQTVVASLNAPSLFLIAKDLTRIQVWVAVNEADIGQIHQGQPVTFSVDALPGTSFKGQVNKVRLNATMTQNVVTYTVEVTADNPGAKLLPYLTANVHFETARHPDVLMVPNSALRWTPPQQYIAPDAQDAQRSSTQPADAQRQGGWQGRQANGQSNGQGQRSDRGPTTRRSASGAPAETTRGTLWVKADNGLLRSIRVRTGPTDGAMTEIQSSDLKDGAEVVVGELRNDMAAAPGSPASPFTPQFGRGGRR
jgi:HlyD family secretion protein